VIVPLDSALVCGPCAALRPGLGLQHGNDVELLEQVQRRATKMIRGLEPLS